MTEKKRFKLSKYVTPTSTSYFHDEQGPMLNGEVVKMLNEQNQTIEKLNNQLKHLMMKSHCQDQEIQKLLEKIEELKQ